MTATLTKAPHCSADVALFPNAVEFTEPANDAALQNGQRRAEISIHPVFMGSPHAGL